MKDTHVTLIEQEYDRLRVTVEGDLDVNKTEDLVIRFLLEECKKQEVNFKNLVMSYGKRIKEVEDKYEYRIKRICDRHQRDLQAIRQYKDMLE